MFKEQFDKSILASNKKLHCFENNKIGYFTSSILAGFYVCFGIFLSFTLVSFFFATPYYKLVYGLSFASALSLVIFAGSELFTGNIFLFTNSILNKSINFNKYVRILAFCLVGNAVGCLILSFIFNLSGGISGGFLDVLITFANNKSSYGVVQLITKGILCNILVCLSVWISYNCSCDVSKLIMIIWCVFMFVTVGFEHSIVNIAILVLTFFADPSLSSVQATFTTASLLNNIIFVLIGNFIGAALFVSVPYKIISKTSYDIDFNK